MTRREQTIVLLRSRTDWHPTLRGQFSTLKATAKPGVGGWEKCERCTGVGRVLGEGLRARPCRGRHDVWPFGHGCRPCLACEEGYVATGLEGTDRMLNPGKHDLATGQQEKIEQRKARERELAHLEHQLRQPRSEADLIAEANEEPEPWERERDKYHRAGDYRAVELALEWLSSESPQGRALIGWVYESGAIDLGCLHESITHAAELAVDLVAARLPDPIRIPHWLVRRAEGGARGQQERRAA